jgi:hypothetical protein
VAARRYAEPRGHARQTPGGIDSARDEALVVGAEQGYLTNRKF